MKKISKSGKILLLLLPGIAAGMLALGLAGAKSEYESKTIDQPERSWNVATAIGPFSNLQIILNLQKK